MGDHESSKVFSNSLTLFCLITSLASTNLYTPFVYQNGLLNLLLYLQFSFHFHQISVTIVAGCPILVPSLISWSSKVNVCFYGFYIVAHFTNPPNIVAVLCLELEVIFLK